MIIKGTVLAFSIIATPFLLAATIQDGPRRAGDPVEGQAGQLQDPADEIKSNRAALEQAASEIEALRAKVRELESNLSSMADAHQQAEARAADAGQHIAKLKAELNGALDLIEASTEKVRERNCTPSRSRKLLTYYQFMKRNGHQARADKMISRVVKATGKRNSSLNSLAWHLLTEKGTAGKFDEAALALTDRMQKQGSLRHNELDTTALAKFLNGHVEAAIALQRQAIKSGGNQSEYRRRLRVYEAAKKTATSRERLGIGVGGSR